MSRLKKKLEKARLGWKIFLIILGGVAVFGLFIFTLSYFGYGELNYTATSTPISIKPKPVLDKVAYDLKMVELANYGTTSLKIITKKIHTANGTTTATSTVPHPWPVKTVYPNAGALLPFNRIVAYYGNFYSTKMGVLGEYPPEQVIQKLTAAVTEWQIADPKTPVIPAIDYIAVTAQGAPGADGKYRLRMPDDQIDKAITMAKQVNGIVILELQVGLSNLATELPLLNKYFKLPNVHLALDPEFSMKKGERPGTVIGTFDAVDINYAANFLANIVRENNLPPKIIVVHRFTQAMVTNYKQITPLPEVQIVMDMDGWGTPERKIGSYNNFIFPEPVQFTGFKIFYKNDLKPPSPRLLTPIDLLKLRPRPSFIQYQ